MTEKQVMFAHLDEMAHRFPRVSFAEALEFFVALDAAIETHGAGLLERDAETAWKPLRSALTSLSIAFRMLRAPKLDPVGRIEARQLINVSGKVLFFSVPVAQKFWYENADGVDGQQDFNAWLEQARAELLRNPLAREPAAWRALWSLDMEDFFARLARVPVCLLTTDVAEMVTGLRNLFEPIQHEEAGLENILYAISIGLQPELVSSLAASELRSFRFRQAMLQRLLEVLTDLLGGGEGRDAMRLLAAPFLRLAP